MGQSMSQSRGLDFASRPEFSGIVSLFAIDAHDYYWCAKYTFILVLGTLT